MGRHSKRADRARLVCGAAAVLLSIALPGHDDVVGYLHGEGVPITAGLATQIIEGKTPTWLAQGAYATFVQVTDGAWDCYHQVLRSYAEGRMVSVSLAEREPEWLGTWDAQEEQHTEQANSEGQLTEWEDHYYIAHDWSDYGQLILSMVLGDEVGINGATVRVEGIFDYPKDGFYEEILELVGPNRVVFQTCEPNSDLNRIVWCE